MTHPGRRWLVPAAWYAVILGLSSIPGSRFDTVPLPDAVAYLVHAVLYGILGLALAWAVGPAGRSRAWIVALVGVGVAFGALDEAYQSTVPGRTSSWLDLAVDAAALATAIGLWGRVVRWCRSRRRRHPPRPERPQPPPGA